MVTGLAILGKAFITVSYSSIYVVTTDTYPTCVRAAGLGLGASMARLGSTASPFVGGILVSIIMDCIEYEMWIWLFRLIREMVSHSMRPPLNYLLPPCTCCHPVAAGYMFGCIGHWPVSQHHVCRPTVDINSAIDEPRSAASRPIVRLITFTK